MLIDESMNDYCLPKEIRDIRKSILSNNSLLSPQNNPVTSVRLNNNINREKLPGSSIRNENDGDRSTKSNVKKTSIVF